MHEHHKLLDIPYVTPDGAGRPDLWPAVGKDISYSDSCELGRERARQVITYMRSREDAHLLLAHLQVQQVHVVTIYGAYQADAIAAFWRAIGSALVN